jgi:hypothetical protein
VSEFLRILEPYTLLVIVDGKIGTFATIDYRGYSMTRDSLTLVDGAGTRFRPLDSSAVSADARAFSALVLRPMFTNMLGPLGANMNAFFFPAKNASGAPLADPRAEGTLRAELGGRSFTWRLPLGSLLPPKYCPLDGEAFSGAYRYCPRHGNRLVDKPPTTPPH